MHVFGGTITDYGHEFNEGEKDRLNQYLKTLSKGIVIWQVKRKYKSITKNQHGYYRGVVVPLIAEKVLFDHDLDYVHSVIAYQFLKRYDDKGIVIGVRSMADADFTTKDTQEFFEKIWHWYATEKGLVIPSPRETIYDYEY